MKAPTYTITSGTMYAAYIEATDVEPGAKAAQHFTYKEIPDPINTLIARVEVDPTNSELHHVGGDGVYVYVPGLETCWHYPRTADEHLQMMSKFFKEYQA